MATTFGSFTLSNGETIFYAQIASAAVGVKLPCDVNRPVVATSNGYEFQVKSPARIIDWETGAIASGAVEIYSNDRPTGVICNLIGASIAKTMRSFPRPVLVPGRVYSLRVSVVLPA